MNTPQAHPEPDWDVQFATPDRIEAAAAEFRADYAAVKAEIGKAIVGHEAVVDGVLTCLFTGGHALLEGVPGIGKTLLIRTLSQALSLTFARVQFTPDLMPADITGTTVVHEAEVEGRTRREFRFAPGPVFAQIVLADEINRATPKTQSALLEAMQERSVTVGGTTHRLPRPFFVMATQNPIEQEGTYPLPEAQLDRFFFKLLVGYSGREELAEVLRRTTTAAHAEVCPVLDAARIERYQQLVRRVAIAPRVRDYAVRLVLATHPRAKVARFSEPGVSKVARFSEPGVSKVARFSEPGVLSPGAHGSERPAAGFATPLVNEFVRVGASPRAAQALELAAKCLALLDRRAAVSTDDIAEAALPALRHRIILNFEGQAEGVSTDTIVENITATLPIDAG